MKRILKTLALAAALTIPADAKEPDSPQPANEPQPLKTTSDQLPEGIQNFNGMVVGRLQEKDVERGTFVVSVDAVPRVWRNSKAENPKSIVGKTVTIDGVFGRFLDVLVVMRPGETIEFECKHAGDHLTFPGELLRKVAPFKPEDYPVLPEGFRGFRGVVAAVVMRKDPETLELIIQVDKVLDRFADSDAKQPESIVGKQLMLAGFWNRREAFHDLKVGDRIEAGMQHLGRQSDHMSVTESIKRIDQP